MCTPNSCPASPASCAAARRPTRIIFDSPREEFLLRYQLETIIAPLNNRLCLPPEPSVRAFDTSVCNCPADLLQHSEFRFMSVARVLRLRGVCASHFATFVSSRNFKGRPLAISFVAAGRIRPRRPLLRDRGRGIVVGEGQRRSRSDRARALAADATWPGAGTNGPGRGASLRLWSRAAKRSIAILRGAPNGRDERPLFLCTR